MTTPRTGILFNRSSDDPKPVLGTDMSTLFVWGPSADATPSVLPYNTPKLFNSSDTDFLAALGTGPLRDAVQVVNAQLGDFQIAARMIVCRTQVGASDAETIANMVGTQAASTGIYAALAAGQIFGIVPRLFVPAGGFTGKFSRTAASTTVSRTAKFGGNTGAGLMTLAAPAYGADAKPGLYQVRCTGGTKAVSSAAKTGGNTGNGTLGTLTVDAGSPVGAWRVVCGAAALNGGSFYVLRPDGTVDGIAAVGTAYNSANGPNFILADGATDFVVSDEFVVTVVNAVPADGGTFSVTDPDGIALATASVGVAYTGTHIKFTIADGATDFVVGDGFDVTVTKSGGVATVNPICAALPQVLSALLAHAIVDGPGLTKQDAIDWRETLSSDRLIPVDAYGAAVGAADNVWTGAASVAAGLGVRCDYQSKGGKGVPSKSWAYQPVYGLTALKRYDGFSLTDGATDGQELFSNNVGFIARGELGVETAAAASGFVFIGADNAGNDELWRFYNVTRTRDYIDLQLLKSWRQRLGTENITRHGIQAVINDMVVVLADLKTDEHIIDFRCGFYPDKNSPENIRLGKIRVFFKAEEASPLLLIEADGYRYRDALNTLISDVAVETSAVLTNV